MIIKYNGFVKVVLPLPVRGIFTYSVPQEFINKIARGKRVLVSFGKKKLYTGVIWEIHNDLSDAAFEIKPILDVLDTAPIINNFQMQLWEWAADYYMCTIGDFYKAALPSGMRLESESRVVFLNHPRHDQPLLPKHKLLLEIIHKEEELSVADIVKISDEKNPLGLLKVLFDNKLISIREEVRLKYKPKTEVYISLSPLMIQKSNIHDTLVLLQRAKKQQLLFQKFIDQIGIDDVLEQKPILKRQFLSETGFSASIIKQLVEKQILIESEVEVSRLENPNEETFKKKTLNENQIAALEQIKVQFESKDVVLLHGVTSSGKTEIYIHLIEEAIENNEQVLYLLPEIALTSQIIQRLKSVFGNKVGVYHSKFSDAERVEIWENIVRNDATSYKVILGVRSSIFLPFKNLGLIIVDEEHENTYKQFDPAPRYNARDLAVVLAALHKTKVLLGTATPSLESYYNAKIGRYGLVELFNRHKDIQLPKIMVADIKKAFKKKQMQSHFTPMLIDNIEDALLKNEQIILFQNRRGFSPYMECSSCGWVPKCKWCDVSLTYHKGINRLVCHYCGYGIESVYRCNQCNQPSIETKGFGTEKVEDEIAIIFPDAKVGRLDLDTTRGKHGHELIISQFQQHEIDILIGTQMVSKGLDFDHVSIVGILSADSMLKFPDFRAYERSYQLMAQVSGRAGRKNKQGKVIVQTYDPENIIINQVQQNNYQQMYLHQMKDRKLFFYPPFSRLVKISLKHHDKNTLDSVSNYLAEELKMLDKCKVLGPTTPVIIRIQNLFIKTILIKLAKDPAIATLKKAIQLRVEGVNTVKAYNGTQIVVDVDPM